MTKTNGYNKQKNIDDDQRNRYHDSDGQMNSDDNPVNESFAADDVAKKFTIQIWSRIETALRIFWVFF